MVKKWNSSPPKECNICREKIIDIFVDGKTVTGPWAIMCTLCFATWGVGLGTGRGQKYTRTTDDEYVKVEG